MAVAPVIIAASAKHTATLIFLHGLGDTGNGWASAMAGIKPPYMKVICPTAPTMPVSLNMGFRMPSWFDLKTLDINGPEDDEGILKATEEIQAIILNEIKEGIPSNRIVLGGFSQGGALAVHAALTFPQPLGGVMALSCWLARHKIYPAGRKCPDTVPILQCHGDCDPLVKYKFGQLSSSILKTFMKNTQFISYRGMTHCSTEEELADMEKFIKTHVPAQ